jgi:RsiW-degrading membrane proteinase PrsW (M82 family)
METLLNVLHSLNAWTIFLAVLGGIIPSVIWLLFWLREDEHPEPKRIVALSFISGGVCVLLTLPLQYIVYFFIDHGKSLAETVAFNFYLGVFVIVIFALVEECFKYLASHWSILQKKEIDEPMDWVIYLISSALGFSAVENVLFLISPILHSNLNSSIATGNFRFIGATVLHTVCSSIIGIFLAFAFYKSKKIKNFARIIGISTAVALHSLFNLFIIKFDKSILLILASVWIIAIVIIILLEKIKKIQPRKKHNL